MTYCKKIKAKWRGFSNSYFSSTRLKKLNNIDFTIISNNCWGGYVYNRYGLPYQSPTVGLYFYADDFIKFVKSLKYYLNCELKFISYKQSKYCNELIRKGQTSVPIGLLDDVEIIFLHYKSEDEANEKWKRRVQRVNYENIIIKFSQANLCSFKHLLEFDSLNFKKKFIFVSRPDRYKLNSAIYFKGFEKEQQVTDDTTNYSKYINITRLINQPIVPYK